MKQNKLTITINKPLKDVFEFTVNPKNTRLWIPFIEEEVSEEFPPKIGTIYKNRGKDSAWSVYKVTEYEEDKLFTLFNAEGDYFVRYTYKPLGDDSTELEYFEWVESGELNSPFTQDILVNLKSVLENN